MNKACRLIVTCLSKFAQTAGRYLIIDTSTFHSVARRRLSSPHRHSYCDAHRQFRVLLSTRCLAHRSVRNPSRAAGVFPRRHDSSQRFARPARHYYFQQIDAPQQSLQHGVGLGQGSPAPCSCVCTDCLNKEPNHHFPPNFLVLTRIVSGACFLLAICVANTQSLVACPAQCCCQICSLSVATTRARNLGRCQLQVKPTFLACRPETNHQSPRASHPESTKFTSL